MRSRIISDILIGTICLCMVTACPLFSVDDPQPLEPVLTPIKAWELDVEAYTSYCYPTQDGRYLYLTTASFWNDQEAPQTVTLEKIDLANGQRIWTSETVPGMDDTIVCPASPYLFIFTRSYLRCYSEESGKLLATIKVNDSNEPQNIPWLDYITYATGCLYWGTLEHSSSFEPKGLVKLSLNDINFHHPPNEPQIIIPEMIYPTGQGILACPIIDQDTLYFLTYNPSFMDNAGYSQLVVLNLLEDSVKWKKNLPSMYGNIPNSLLIHEDTLYIIDSSTAAFDKNTGIEKYLYDTTKMDLSKEFYRGGSGRSAGITYYEGKLYYVNTMHSGTPSLGKIPWELVYNMVCIDADTGEVIWKNRPSGTFGSIGANPVVANGRAYFLTSNGIRVYEADSGRLIGVYKDVENTGLDRTFTYNGMMIFRNKNKKDRSTKLTAIRI